MREARYHRQEGFNLTFTSGLSAGFHSLMAAPQVAEEARFWGRPRSLADPSSDREHAEDLSQDLAQGRLSTRRI